MRRLLRIVLLGLLALGTVGALAPAIARADDQISVHDLDIGNYNADLHPSRAVYPGAWAAADLATFYADLGDDGAKDTRIGNTPFTCKPGMPSDCDNQDTAGHQFATGMYAFEFQPDDDAGVGLQSGDLVRILSSPAGTVYPSDPNDYVVATGCSEQTISPTVDPGGEDFGGSGYVCNGGPVVVRHVDVRSGGNQVVVEMPEPIPAGGGSCSGGLTPGPGSGPCDATLFIAGVRNPPKGKYSNLDYEVTTSRQTTPGYPPSGGQQVFDDSGDISSGNSSLEASMGRVKVSDSPAVSVTATIRDRYGNGIDGLDVFILPSRGAPTGNFTQTSTQDDGTVSERFYDETAEITRFRAIVNGGADELPERATVVFTPGRPDPAHSRITVDPATVPADGSQAAVVTVDLADEFGNPTIQPDSGVGDQIYLQPQVFNGVFPFVNGHIEPAEDSACVSTTVAGAGCTNTPIVLPGSPAGSPPNAAQATFRLTDTTAEKVDFKVEDLTSPAGGGGLCLGDPFCVHPQAITFTALAPDPSASTIAAAPSSVTADGQAKGQVTVTLKDVHQNPVSGVAVSLAQSQGSHATITPESAKTDGSGRQVFDVSDPVAEDAAFTASYSGCAPSPPSYCTTPGQATLSFVPGGASATKSTAVASPASVLADGTASSTVTVTLIDSQGNPAAGKRVELTQRSGAHSTITPAAGTTDSHGQTRFTVTDQTPESVTYTATDTTDSPSVAVAQQPTVTFTSIPSTGHSTITAAPASVPADGTAVSQLTVTLLDSNGAPVAGKAICLTGATGPGACDPASGSSVATAQTIPVAGSAGSGCPAQADAGTTDCKGQAVFTVTDSTVEAVTYGFIDLTDFPSGPPLGPKATVTFTQPRTEAGASTVTASPAQVLADTDGPTGTSTVTVTLIGADGAPVAGHTVKLAASSASSTVTPATAATGADGKASFAVTDTQAESVTYTATDVTASPNVTLQKTAKVSFIADEAALSTVEAASPTAIADGGASDAGTDYVTVTLDPDHPLTGHQVTLTQSTGGHSAIAAVAIPDADSGCTQQADAGTSDCHGKARFKVTDGTVETVTYTAHDKASGVKLDDQAKVQFVAPGPVISRLAPASGPVAGGTPVTITGTDLYDAAHVPAVKFGAAPATNVSCSAATSCTATSPAASGAGPVAVTLTTASGVSTPATPGAATFTYLAAPPTVAAVSPKTGPRRGGTTVTVTGTNLGSVASTTVHFGSATVKPKSVSADGTQLTVVAPAETFGLVNVTVTTPAGTSPTTFADWFIYLF